MKPKLLIVTGNIMKFRELSLGLSEFFDCEQAIFDEPEIQGDAEEILNYKVKKAYEFFKQPLLVDDVSVHLDYLGGFPGPYMKDFFKHLTPYEMGNKFAGTRIKAICRLALCRAENDTIVAEGVMCGDIVAPTLKDHGDRHFDFFTKVDGTDRPLIEFSAEEKNKISHRGRAMEKLLEILNKN
ncbi:MAG: non-canonical purine NTP pyrophosphatase [Candidatus Pacebacteria bacterium]|nr:non-canonical purine NTP pyrophosphatase [Candidatus Paceibacterota bacterium]